MSEDWRETVAVVTIPRKSESRGTSLLVEKITNAMESYKRGFEEMFYDSAFPDSPEATARRQAREAAEREEKAARDALLVGAKPCPWCDGAPEWTQNDEGFGGYTILTCGLCQARGPYDDHDGSHERSVELWNKR